MKWIFPVDRYRLMFGAMSPGILLAFAAAVAYGATDFVGGAASRRYTSWQVVLIGQATGALVMLVASLASPGSPVAPDFAWSLLAAFGSAMGSIFLFRGLARGRMGLVAPISAVGAATLPVLVGVALGERPGWLVWIGVLAALPGIWLVSRDSTSDELASGPSRSVATRGALVDGILAGAGFGILFVALAQFSDSAGPLPLAANQLIAGALTLTIAVSLKQPWRPSRGVVPWGAATGVLGSAGTLSFTVATGLTSLGIAAVIASLYPAITVLLAATLLGERVGTGQRAGIGVCTVAIAALALA